MRNWAGPSRPHEGALYAQDPHSHLFLSRKEPNDPVSFEISTPCTASAPWQRGRAPTLPHRAVPRMRVSPECSPLSSVLEKRQQQGLLGFKPVLLPPTPLPGPPPRFPGTQEAHFKTPCCFSLSKTLDTGLRTGELSEEISRRGWLELRRLFPHQRRNRILSQAQPHFLCHSGPLWNDSTFGSLWFPSPQQLLLFCSVFFGLSSRSSQGNSRVVLITLSSSSPFSLASPQISQEPGKPPLGTLQDSTSLVQLLTSDSLTLSLSPGAT